MLQQGPDLIDLFVPGKALLVRAQSSALGGAHAAWLAQLEELVKRRAAQPTGIQRSQPELFEQYARVLQALARCSPLILALDDLQWADVGSISLLFHLGRRLSGSRIL